VIEIHEQIMEKANESGAITDRGLLESAVAQPQMTFDGTDLYPTIIEKAAALGFSMIKNHPFIDGNKRAGHGAMENFLHINGWEIRASVDEQEAIILQLADGVLTREELTTWLRDHIGRQRYRSR
jgi:death-on-curing protein